MTGTTWVKVELPNEDVETFREEARRQTAKEITKVGRGDILRRELRRDAARLRSKHKALAAP